MISARPATPHTPHYVFLVCFVLFGLSVHPSLPGGDSPELIHVASTLGIAHPPGYPLYTLLGYLVTRLPLGSPALALNLFSAFLTALSAALLAVFFSRAGGSAILAGALSVLWATSPLVWKSALVAEVFPLNTFLLVAFLLSAQNFLRTGNGRNGAAFVAGLAIANHHLSVLLTLPATAYIFFQESPKQWRQWGRAGCFFALGLLPYVYLPLRAESLPFASWGTAFTWDGFWTHLLRREYGTFQLAASAVGQSSEPLLGLWHFLRSSLWAAFPLFFLAVWATSLRTKKLPPPPAATTPPTFGKMQHILFASTVLYLLVFLTLANLPFSEPFYREITGRFWAQPFLGLFALLGLLLIRQQPRAAVAWVSVPLVMVQIFIGFQLLSQTGNQVIEKFSRSALSSLPPGAVLFTCGDAFSSSVRYLQEVQGLRPDVQSIDTPLLKRPWYRDWLQKHRPDAVPPHNLRLSLWVETLFSQKPVFAMGEMCNIFGETDFATRVMALPAGCNEALVPRASSFAIDRATAEASQSARPCEALEEGSHFPPGSWEHELSLALRSARDKKMQSLPKTSRY